MAWKHNEKSKLLPETKIFILTDSNCKSNKCCSCLSMTLVYAALFFAAVSLVAFFAAGLYSYPIHASCRIQWTFGKSCDDVKATLINQMEIWRTADNCANGGEKCLYEYLSSTDTTLIGTHETPVKHYIDNLKFIFTPLSSNMCSVQGYSSSLLWYALLDYGTNYCNLHNLVVGANLHMESNYTETTRDDVCTQYSSADCEIY